MLITSGPLKTCLYALNAYNLRHSKGTALLRDLARLTSDIQDLVRANPGKGWCVQQCTIQPPGVFLMLKNLLTTLPENLYLVVPERHERSGTAAGKKQCRPNRSSHTTEDRMSHLQQPDSNQAPGAVCAYQESGSCSEVISVRSRGSKVKRSMNGRYLPRVISQRLYTL